MQTAAILAGGRARRLDGRDKSRIVIGGRTILERQLDALRRLVPRIVIVANEPERFADAGVPVLADALPGTGSLGAIYTAIADAAGPVLVVACDMPFVTAPFLARVIDAGRDADVAIPRGHDGYQPLCANYAPSCAGPVRARIERGALQVVGLLTDVRVREIGPAEIAPFDPDGLLLLNVNTADDLARAERAAGARDAAHRSPIVDG
ncbi:MAG TPA: molybdenum cofactor guanylyltransferase [Vicinamibacterales bacterium]|jgi:molybdopterin-guanine dinucleotide biosynthesis protein A|nr:molybdenum cofactor guanylyltransferase [Vicinamibacterales bacterium]